LIGLLQRPQRESVTTICRAILKDVDACRQGEGLDEVTVVAPRRSANSSKMARETDDEEIGVMLRLCFSRRGQLVDLFSRRSGDEGTTILADHGVCRAGGLRSALGL
jgi:hypothetical protein